MRHNHHDVEHQVHLGGTADETPTGVQLWRWRLVAPGPPLTAALHVGEALKAAVTRVSCDRGSGLLPTAVYKDESGAHGHAFWLPGDEDGDGLIDHAWVFCANGLPRAMIATLATVPYVAVGGRRFDLTPEWMSPRVDGGPFGPARVWRGVTPYVTPRWRLSKTGKERAGFTPEAQLRDEIVKRGLPAVAAITWEPMTWIGEQLVMASVFQTRKVDNTRADATDGGGSGAAHGATRSGGSGNGRAPTGDAVAAFPTIRFTAPVLGPLAFGFGAHFGLGQVMPVMG